MAFWALTTAAFVVAVPTVLRLVPDTAFDVGGLPVRDDARRRRRGGVRRDHRRRPPSPRWHSATPTPLADRPRAVLTDAARESAVVGTWVVVAFVGYEVVVAATGLDVGAVPRLGLVGVLAGAALGLIPGCGPQLVLTGLYAQGVLPLSTLAANALSQDGDALFPLLIADRRAAITASAITALPAVLVGGGLSLVGL